MTTKRQGGEPSKACVSSMAAKVRAPLLLALVLMLLFFAILMLTEMTGKTI